MTETAPRRIDHVVMPVESLDGIRRLLSALGFTVAPNATHPFGTANACVFFADGTYIEPLAVADRERCEAEARAGNVFVAGDQSFRSKTALPGLSGIAIASVDAEADRARFTAAGLSAGDNLEFRRIARSPSGEETELGFRLAFARDRSSPDLSLFTCQPLHSVQPDRRALTGHENGVRGLARIVMSAQDPAAFAEVLRTVLGARGDASDDENVRPRAENAEIEILSPGAVSIRYGVDCDEGQGLSIAGLVLSSATPDGIEERARRSGHAVRVVSNSVTVPLGDGRSPFLAFEAVVGGAENAPAS